MSEQSHDRPSVATRMRALRKGGAGHGGRKPGPRGPRKEKSAAKREAILAAALEEFSLCGFEAARLDDVARRADVAKGPIYLYFRDKEALFQELLRHMLTPIIGTLEALGQADLPVSAFADTIVELFVREIYETRRKDVIRLMITEGRRFPKLAEFYYREVLSRIIAAVRALLARAAAKGEVPPGLVEKYEPLDVRKMMKTHVEQLFAPRRAA